MTFRNSEKANQISKKHLIASPEANIPGTYAKGKTKYEYCLNNNFAYENIPYMIRNNALAYFSERGIPWHQGVIFNKHLLPENHLCSSQISCINHLFYFIDKPKELEIILSKIGYNVKKVLPFEADMIIEGNHSNGKKPYIAFEWIGEKNYLNELYLGKVAKDNSRTRGANFTSADFSVRFEDNEGKIKIILGEWKYTEKYTSENKRYSKSNTDRYIKVYKQFLEDANCPIKMVPGTTHDDLFYDPFDQLMRLQLLAREMEKAKEMEADSVEVLVIAPERNKEYMNNVTSSNLKILGNDISDVWNQLVLPGKFKYYKSEKLLEDITSTVSNIDIKDYLELRYSRF